MQDWIEQANKKNVAILQHGRCQFCFSRTERGVAECVEVASLATHKIDHPLGIEHRTIFLCVDAHALQHPEIHGRWNNHFHLARLNLILADQVRWEYPFSPVLSSVVNTYKAGRSDEFIPPPKAGSRGELTVTDVLDTNSPEEYVRIVWSWAQQVHSAYADGHEIAKEISRLFRNRIARS